MRAKRGSTERDEYIRDSNIFLYEIRTTPRTVSLLRDESIDTLDWMIRRSLIHGAVRVMSTTVVLGKGQWRYCLWC